MKLGLKLLFELDEDAPLRDQLFELDDQEVKLSMLGFKKIHTRFNCKTVERFKALCRVDEAPDTPVEGLGISNNLVLVSEFGPNEVVFSYQPQQG
jgi:hypothetical protein